MGYRGDPGVKLLPHELVKRFRRCCLCRGFLPKRRISWCSDACISRWRLLCGDSNAVASFLIERDREVCQLCGIDLRLVDRILDRLQCLPGDVRPDGWVGSRDAWLEGLARKRFLLWDLGWSLKRARGGVLWEGDHRIPVVEGGTNQPENLRTLCVPCHDGETRKLAARRAVARRVSAALPLLDGPPA